MATSKSRKGASANNDSLNGQDQNEDEDVVLDGTLVCALTGEHRTVKPEEETLQSVIEQLHSEYGVALEDMARDVRLDSFSGDEGGKQRKKRRTVQLVVYASGKPHEGIQDIIRAVLVAKPGTKSGKGVSELDEVLGSLNDERDEVFGLWTNGTDLAFRLRRYHPRSGNPEFVDLADFPAPDESLEDLEDAARKPLRVASGDSLLRTFRRCHDYLYGNQSMRGDRAFWQLLYLIFAKILDERTSSREFFVGATERNTAKGQQQIATRIKKLFDRVKDEYGDVFDGPERIELNDRALAYIAGELARYNLLSTDTDAKGAAYEEITSTTLKRERGQFFTPRNVIRMMVNMTDPAPDKKVLDPACGSGGFLVVALAHVRRQLLADLGCPYPDQPVPKELKKVDPLLRKYAGKYLWGLDVDPDLRKAARMNMVMNNDGHGNIYAANSLELVAAQHAHATDGARAFMSEAMHEFVKRSGGLGAFDYVFTNPPFGAKIPVEDPDLLSAYDLGRSWSRSGDSWVKGNVQKKVPPEILFIEACFRFLKPGSGVMALVLPNGILGNPGEQMEFVRWWMLRNMELIASVDLPAEAFLPQVSVQASCVFLRRRTEDELRLLGQSCPTQRPVFMAIAEACGHGRRGESTYRRAPDGSELVEETTVIDRRERRRKIEERTRSKRMKILADDLPWIAEEYKRMRDESR